MTKKCPAIRQMMMPKDTNPMEKIFGGVILAQIDIAGAVAARAICTNKKVVTRSMKEVQFTKPVLVGDLLTCWTEIVAVGESSITVRVEVESERRDVGIVPVTSATVVYVAIDDNDHKTPVVLTEQYKKELARKSKGRNRDKHSEGDCGCNKSK